MVAKHKRSPLALAVLALLAAQPLHPYGVLALIKQWGKDQVINVTQRATLYKTFNRLTDAGLIAVQQTERDQQYPERTVYKLTEDGREVMLEWLAEVLVGGHNEFPEFPVGLSFIMLLTPEDTLPLLNERAKHLSGRLEQLEADLAEALSPGPDQVPAVSLLEGDYLRAMVAAELSWVEKLVADIENGRMRWGVEELRAFAETHPPEI
ncbi:PadR family transcriptional regulator [Amycolatopsis sp. NPDC059021]|uniref:PadR family transcriptional regulator n=1 Tax=Amycolatopsis sp. NPDC059021 TaxID=3346704 RepID=UPI00366E8B94